VWLARRSVHGRTKLSPAWAGGTGEPWPQAEHWIKRRKLRHSGLQAARVARPFHVEGAVVRTPLMFRTTQGVARLRQDPRANPLRARHERLDRLSPDARVLRAATSAHRTYGTHAHRDVAAHHGRADAAARGAEARSAGRRCVDAARGNEPGTPTLSRPAALGCAGAATL
jgi:hypothetical protein